ncbi:hypothetical protein CEXT_354391 [Caerostris extrusa]|uniref:Uncharacterized protein n=1 Tax=Caerostris extrusa TaxID=172846 RepID=A0AAV4Y1A9_CAEEX|nr:hypothetical protein CEXT_354391 [Caerostris extrusa]
MSLIIFDAEWPTVTFKASVYEDIIDDTFTQSRVSCSQQCDKPNASQPLRGWNSSDTGWSLCDSNVAHINVLVEVSPFEVDVISGDNVIVLEKNIKKPHSSQRCALGIPHGKNTQKSVPQHIVVPCR